MTTVTFGDLTLELRESPRRRTVGITVERDGRLVLACPPGTPPADLERTVDASRHWIYSRLAEKEALARPPSRKEYVSGEGLYYLGRSYRLKLVDPVAGRPALRLQHGRFELRRDGQERGREYFVRWYRVHLLPVLERHIAALAGRIEARPAALQVRDLGYRWSSCGKEGTLYFHWRVAMLPPAMIEYLVGHELVHLVERRHTRAFWQRLERIVPDYAERVRRLAENGVQYDL